MMVKKKHFFPVKTTFLLTILAFLFSIFFASTPSTFAVTEEENNCRNSHGNWVNDQCDCGSGRIMGSDGSCVSSNSNATTLSGVDGVYKKALFLGVYNCYNNKLQSTTFNVSDNKFLSWNNDNSSNIFKDDDGSRFVIPTNVSNSAYWSSFKCHQGIDGYQAAGYSSSKQDNHAQGLLQLYGKSAIGSDYAMTGSDYEFLGFEPAGSEDQGSYNSTTTLHLSRTGFDKDLSIEMHYTNSLVGSAPTVTFDGANLSVEEKAHNSGYTITRTTLEGTFPTTLDTTKGPIFLFEFKDGDETLYFAAAAGQNAYGDLRYYLYFLGTQKTVSGNTATYSGARNNGGNTFILYWSKDGKSKEEGNLSISTEGKQYTATISDFKVESAGVSNKYKITDKSAAFWKFVDNLTNSSLSHDTSQFNISDDEKAALYTNYINKLMGQSENSGVFKFSSECYDAVPENKGSGEYYAIKSEKWCLVEGVNQVKVQHNTVANNEGRYALVSADGNSLSFTSGTDVNAVKEVLEALMALSGKINLENVESQSTETPVNPGEGMTTEETCYNASSISWIVCPIIEQVGKWIDQIYGEIENQLQVKPSLFQNGGIRSAWQVFQGVANIAVIIFLLIVVFSQVTGFGINNYGIKKSLPKLIVAVILVNLSFIICTIAVDVSNILGANLQDMFQSFANSVSANTTRVTVRDTATSIVENLAVGGFLIGGIATLVVTWSLWLMPFLIFLIGFLVSILVFFVTVEVREIVVILLTCISPLIFACYILPNTQKYFKWWQKGFIGAVMAYPICSAIMGIGDFGSAILLSTIVSNGGSIFAFLIAELVSVLPFFFVPSILKRSLSGIMNIGATISNLGNRAGRSLGRGFQGSGAGRSISERTAESQRQRQMNRNQRIASRLRDRQDAGEELSAYNRRRLAIHTAAYNAARREDIVAQTANPELLVEGTAAYAAVEAGVENQEREKRIGDRVALLQANNPDNNTLFADYQAAIDNGDNDQAVAIARYAGRSKPTANAFSDYIKANTNTMNRAVAREIMTGANAGTYKASNATLYEYASQVHTDDRTHNVFVNPTAVRGDVDYDAVVDYADWATADITEGGVHTSNIDLAVEHNMSKPEELAGQGRSTLREVEAAKNRTTHTYQSGTATRAANFSTITTFRPGQEQALERNAAGALTLENVDNTKEQNYRNIANGRGTIAQENAAAAADIAAARSSDTLAGTYRDSAGNIRHVVRNADGTYNLFDGNNVQVHIRRGPTTANDVDSNLRGGGYTKV